MMDANDFDPSFRLAWDDQGLLVLTDVTDDRVVEYQSRNGMWNKDSMEIFIAHEIGVPGRLQLGVGTGADPRFPETRTFIYDSGPAKYSSNPNIEAKGSKTKTGYQVEVRIPWDAIDAEAELGRELAFQILMNESDKVGPFTRANWYRAFWHPKGHAGFNTRAYHRIRLAKKASKTVRFTRSHEKGPKGLYQAEPQEYYDPIRIPKLDGITIDGQPGDWGERGFIQKNMISDDGFAKATQDFAVSLRLGWNDDGLLFRADVTDNSVVEYPVAEELWRKDSIELFLAPKRGSRDFVQTNFGPLVNTTADNKHLFVYDHRSYKNKKPIKTIAVSKKTETGYCLEALLPWSNVNIKPATGKEIGVQAFINDADFVKKTPGDWFRVSWNPLGHPDLKRTALHRIILSDAAEAPVSFTISDKENASKRFPVMKPLPWPVPKVDAGRSGENADWNGKWTASTSTASNRFTAEMAIPWSTLNELGFKKDRLKVNVTMNGPIGLPPDFSWKVEDKFTPLLFQDTAQSSERRYNVRLHFAELVDGVDAGDRVFDIRIQDKVVKKNFDIVQTAGGVRIACTVDLQNIRAEDLITLSFVQKGALPPILNALELKAR
jgi:hypothetical protein